MLQRINSIFHSLFVYPFRFRHFGHRSKLVAPMRLDGVRNMEIGDDVYVGHSVWLGASNCDTVRYPPLLKIGDGCRIGNFNHIYAVRKIVIENDVLTADKVCILDSRHGFEDIETPIWKQPVEPLAEVRIGEGSWLGEHVCVLGASVGKHCVIGANSVVTHDIPDYSVAVGMPARIIKKFNFETHRWEKI